MTPPRNWHKRLMLSLLGLALSARTIGCDYGSITEKFGAEAVAHCNEKCPFQNRTGDGHFDMSCGSHCSIQQCTLGCSLWKQGLEQSCPSTCNVTSETVFSRELYCVMGCNEALNSYYQKLRELISTPPAPALLADSLTATSLSLLWEAPDISNLTYMVQWRYEDLQGTWQYYSNSSHKDRSIISVENLRPYTKYRFRVAIFLSGRGAAGEPVYSAPSVVISTSESGRPSSAPEALRAAAPDPSRVAISWEPGPFPNGPLISYVLRLVDTQPNTYAALEDMPASNNTLFYMFQNLAPAREYEVSVAMRNAVGEGPRAYVRVATPAPIAAPSEQPILILGGQHKVLAAQANDMLSDPIELYATKHNITGVGLDISSDYLFVSDTSGFVYRTSLSKKSPSVPILTPDNISYRPLDLSVDWLNRHLYVLGEVYYTRDNTGLRNASIFSNWEILRCDFDGKNQLVALSGFNTKPVHFEVDPYNGYLFWSVRGVERGGLYRLDLADISNGVRHDAPPELIVRDAQLGAFTVDHADFRLLVAHLQKNTVLAVSLDGREVSNFRNNTQSPMFQSARSIAFAGGLFYWTNGEEMLAEEYHAESDSYYHNEYPLSRNTNMIKVLVHLRSCQPIPVPVNPPISVQSVMGIKRAKVSWAPPHRLGHQGSGAWQHWSFHLQLTHADTGEIKAWKDINGSTYIVENLLEDTEYIIKVAAVTESGRGPWSTEFIGRTLASSPTTLHSTLIWSGPDGLLQTDLTGDNLQTLIHRAHLKDLHITDISWYRDKLYLVTNASTVLWYNTTSHEKGWMANMDNVGSLAVDWVGKRIYWSNPKQQLITRGNLEGGSREPVPIVTVAKELTIDSLRAYIYWNTGHAVEAARLNGENKIVYYPAQLFSGKQVMGLTADLEKRWLYWLVHSYDGSELHKAPTADRISQMSEEISSSLVTRMTGSATLGPLCYFSGRLVWVQDASRAVVSDLDGRYTADLVPRVHVIAVRDPTLHAHSESLTAIPETINATSLEVSGTWEQFNVTWSPAARVNHGRVSYDISLLFENQQRIERTVESHWLEIHDSNIPPYSGVEVSVRAHTPWGGSGAARATLRTPQAAPSAPTKPRLYLQPLGGDSLPRVVFRWNDPSKLNGQIRGFETQCWMLPVKAPPAVTPARPPACAAHLSSTQTELVLRDLMPNTTYYFQVRAYTDAGLGPYSEVVSASSNTVNPIPKVVISSQETIRSIDLDSGDSISIPKSTGIPNDFSISIDENVVYWANNLEEIFSSRINGSGNYKLTSINGSASSICVDWVGRVVYWAQMETASVDSYVIYRTELTLHNTRPHFTRLFASRRPVYNLQIAALTRTLYWYEESLHPGLGTLMTTKIDNIDIEPFFDLAKDRHKTRNTNCNCPENPQVAKSFVLDMTTEGKHELYWVDPWVYKIYASDMTGCKCRVVVAAQDKDKYGFIPMSISVDSKNIYWFNATEKYIYYTDKKKKSKIEKTKVSHGYKIIALDPRNQPYPPKHCLYPKAGKLTPTVLADSADSITLALPPVKKHEECAGIDFEMTANEYTIYYRPHTKNDTFCDKNSCSSVSTTGAEATLTNLTPFTNYLVLVEVTNYYAKLHEVRPLSGPPAILRTAAEAPRAARDVSAAALSPEMARVEWTPEPGLWYELHWRTNDSTLPHNFKEYNAIVVAEGGAANISRLSPNTSYAVWVRARSNHSSHAADSRPVALRTYPLPAPLALVNATAYQIRVAWPPPTTYVITRYEVEYSEAMGAGKWAACAAGERRGQWATARLRPRTRYKFRLKLQYSTRAPPYSWPADDRFTYETLGDRPGAPGVPLVESVGDRMMRVWWSEPDPRGAPLLAYRVWGRPHSRVNQMNANATTNLSHVPAGLPDDIDDELKIRIVREGLELLHNGTENYWLVGAGEVSGRYGVRVQARNALGWGALSGAAELDASALAMAARPPHAAAALAAAAAALAAIALTVAAGFLFMYKNRSKKKAAIETQNAIGAARRGPDVELATLRQLPIRHSTNILYNQGGHPAQAELAALPHIRRDQITLTKFLGSGAFGEVFEGAARRLAADGSDTKVAVKTLRKGATDQEKSEFLQEAALMSNFKHEHILRLLGVCLDNDPNFIIMELMEGGDLLSYLRAKRASLYTSESLTLLDLLNMCVDVTKGCRYLEEMHFVHRDLACRNCLVAQRGAGRVVKIGDFGLARDIYKNDYYRKEGEGLLPVRWMAVECLVDGVFSCQSDVWAWGVLCWEVLSLGQQPYPARTNRQVLAYVRAGGTPTRPPNCPSPFYELLQKCWSYSAEQRPTFKHCLEVVTALRDATPAHAALSASAPAAAPPHYLTLLADDDVVENRAYLLHENDDSCLDEDFSEQQMEPSRLLPERRPEYLELMHDSDSGAGAAGDGYEVPRTRHSIVGVAPYRLVRPPYRTRSLRAPRPPNATVVPLRAGRTKRVSLCDALLECAPPRPASRAPPDPSDADERKRDHVFKTTF